MSVQGRQRLVQTVRYRMRVLLESIRPETLPLLMRPSGHSLLLEQQRTRQMIFRVRIVALTFGLLTPLWIVVDLVALPWHLGWQLALTRLLASAAFLALAFGFPRHEGRGWAWGAMGLMFAIPTIFFLYSHPLLAVHELSGLAGVVAASYAFLPFVMLAGLGIFPLTAAETLLFSLPVLASKGVLALFQLDALQWTTHLGSFWLLLLITVVAAFCGISQLHLMNALVERSAHDPLTGCVNRGSGEELLDRHLALAARHNRPLAVAFMDLDRFKAINDRYGHEAGDLVLRQAVEHIRRMLRGTDPLVRWGGEEFVAIFPDTGLDGAKEALERVLAAGGLGNRPDGEPLTVSVGLAESHEVDGDGAALVELADRRMYLGKRAGGDCIVTDGGAAACGQALPEAV